MCTDPVVLVGIVFSECYTWIKNNQSLHGYYIKQTQHPHTWPDPTWPMLLYPAPVSQCLCLFVYPRVYYKGCSFYRAAHSKSLFFQVNVCVHNWYMKQHMIGWRVILPTAWVKGFDQSCLTFTSSVVDTYNSPERNRLYMLVPLFPSSSPSPPLNWDDKTKSLCGILPKIISIVM